MFVPSNHGNLLSIGASRNDGNCSDSGHMRVFVWDETHIKFVLLSADIDGEAVGDYSGNEGAISRDGKLLVIGAH